MEQTNKIKEFIQKEELLATQVLNLVNSCNNILANKDFSDEERKRKCIIIEIQNKITNSLPLVYRYNQHTKKSINRLTSELLDIIL